MILKTVSRALIVTLMPVVLAAEPDAINIVGEVVPKIATIDKPTLAKFKHDKITHITFHHEGFAGENADLFAKASKARLRQSVTERVLNINAFHAKEAGLGMIAYHYAVAPDGMIAKGRPVKYKPATKSTLRGSTKLADFDGHFAVVALGDFNHEKLTGAALLSYIKVMSEAQRKYRVPTANIQPHWDHASTSCPGEHILEIADVLRQSVMIRSFQAELMARGCGKLQPDGVWGHRTGEAFERFQDVHKASYQGQVFGDAALMEMLNKPDLACR